MSEAFAARSEFEVRLPIGHEGRQEAVLRKMCGHEEALLYDPSLSAGRLITALLKGCLVRLGERAEVTAEMVSALHTADRSYLLVELRRITLGDALHASYPCPRCAREIPVVEDLSSLPLRRVAAGAEVERVEVELEDGYRDREQVVHRSVRLRLPRGTDEEFVARVAEKDPLRARDVLVLRCIEKFGTLPKAALEGYGMKILADLTMGDRWRLYQALEAGSPGIDFHRSVRCESCGVRFETALETSSFFVPG